VKDDGRPLFLQIAELIATSVVDGSYPEGTQVPSSNELAAFHRINPATAAKGLNELVDQQVLHKRRGIGMFVSPGARTRLLERRRDEFARQYVAPLITEARQLGIDGEQLKKMIDVWEEEA
jgi:GntR family transcriptional regulator